MGARSRAKGQLHRDRLLQLRANLSAKPKAVPPVSGVVIHSEPADIAAGETVPGLTIVVAVSSD
ncbi:DUF3459 domain-containing protein [Neorhizobium galegae]|uniref:DUF3459 domain-containing protein n=1 Tax=Neorhizobium galegae TaxID=399 RepID=UPI000ACC1B51